MTHRGLGKTGATAGSPRKSSGSFVRFVAIALSAVAIISAAAVVLDFQIMRGAPLELHVDAPDDVRSREHFAIVVSVQNPSDTDVVSWTGIELDDAYATIESSDPAWMNVDYSDGRHLIEFGAIDVQPSSTAKVTLQLQAHDSATSRSDVTVYSRGPFGMSCPASTVRIQTKVLASGAAPP